MKFPPRLNIPGAILDIARTLDAAGFEAWCVGGTLRDTLLDQPAARGDHILDLPVAQVPPDLLLKRLAKGGRAAVVDREESKAMVEPHLAIRGI